MNAIEKFKLRIEDTAMHMEKTQTGRMLLSDGITLFWADADSLDLADGETYDNWCLLANAEPA